MSLREVWSEPLEPRRLLSASVAHAQANLIPGAANSLPYTPTNIWPPAGATSVVLRPVLQSSKFGGPDGGDKQVASEWVVTRAGTGAKVIDTGADLYHLTSWAPPAGMLAHSTAYSWKVRYEDNDGTWSKFSPPSTFNTLSTASIEIMPLGDSLTTGAYAWGKATGGYRLGLYGDLKADGLSFNYVGSQVDNLSKPLEFASETHNEGHPGFRADEIANNLLGVDNSHTGSSGGHWLNGIGARKPVYPNIVLLEAGTNDILEGDSLSEAAAHISNLIGILTTARPNARILVGSLLPIDERQHLPEVKALNALLRNSIVPKYQHLGRSVTFVDQYQNFVNASGNVVSSLLYDHIHPVAAGYTLMANTWAAAISNALMR